MRLRGITDTTWPRIHAALAECQTSGDLLFVDIEGTALQPEPLLTRVTQDSATGAYTLRSQTGCIFEVFACGKTLAEAVSLYRQRWQEMRDHPRHVPD